jgi:folate-dependent phosphoribosylglycinamide formyltransferase PurN
MTIKSPLASLQSLARRLRQHSPDDVDQDAGIAASVDRIQRGIEIHLKHLPSFLTKAKLDDVAERIETLAHLIAFAAFRFADASYLSTSLKFDDAWPRALGNTPGKAVRRLNVAMLAQFKDDDSLPQVPKSRVESLTPLTDWPQLPTEAWQGDAKKIIIVAPTARSLYAVCTAELLHRAGLTPTMVVQRKMLNLDRIRSELRRDGARLLRKVWKKWVKSGRVEGRPYETMFQLAKRLSPEATTVPAWARRNRVTHVVCDDFESEALLQQLHRLGPDLTIFCGGGMLRKGFLAACNHKILNCHMGILPRYRGMDVVEWPMVEGCLDQIGHSVHYMVRKLDAGDVLKQLFVPLSGVESIVQLRERMEWAMPVMMAHTALDLFNDRCPARAQQEELGKQYYVMHPRIGELARLRFEQYRAAHHSSGAGA